MLEQNALRTRIKVSPIPNLIREDAAAAVLQAALCGHTTRCAQRDSERATAVLQATVKGRAVKREVDQVVRTIERLQHHGSQHRTRDDAGDISKWIVV